MKKKLSFGLCLLLLVLFCVRIEQLCMLSGRIMNLKADSTESDAFRAQELSAEILQNLQKNSADEKKTWGSLLAVWMPALGYDLSREPVISREFFNTWDACFQTYRAIPYRNMQKACRAIWDDLVCFPVDIPVSYENTWMFERKYGGKRGHEGTDLMPPDNRKNIYPVYSMTAGTVEKIGWLDKGGYRIGIRACHGGYFYYAHLSSYGEGIREGQYIRAGELLGYMGDSGYGKEGTTGKFDVHLHVGIYIDTEQKKELSINPYWILKSLESHKLKCRYQM